MDKKINLEEILDEALNKADFDLFGEDKKVVIVAMKEAIRQALEIASENARTIYDSYENLINGDETYIVDKQSIINTINQIE